jgi:hypothetical protein
MRVNPGAFCMSSSSLQISVFCLREGFGFFCKSLRISAVVSSRLFEEDASATLARSVASSLTSQGPWQAHYHLKRLWSRLVSPSFPCCVIPMDWRVVAVCALTPACIQANISNRITDAMALALRLSLICACIFFDFVYQSQA